MEKEASKEDINFSKSKIRELVLNYNQKNKKRISEILKDYDNHLVIDSILDIIEENPCAIYYICSMLIV